jgi:hypothetical protein
MNRCENDKCLLCEINDANETNSHIIPRMLAKTISDYKPSKARGGEIEFGINIGKGTETFTGAAVDSKKLKELYGDDVDLELLKKKQDLYALDYIFCKSCEKKLATIETLYAEYLGKSKIPTHISYLFWASVVVRVALTEFCGSTYPDKIIRQLSNQLNQYLLEDVKSFKKQDYSKLNIKPFTIMKCESIKSDSYVIDGPQHQLPIRLVVGQYVVFLFDKAKRLKNIDWTFFGFEKHLSMESVNDIEFEKTIQISDQQFKASLDKITVFMKDKTLESFYTTIDHWTNQLSSGKMKKAPKDIKEAIIARLANSERGLADKYTIEALSEETAQLFLEIGWTRI